MNMLHFWTYHFSFSRLFKFLNATSCLPGHKIIINSLVLRSQFFCFFDSLIYLLGFIVGIFYSLLEHLDSVSETVQFIGCVMDRNGRLL